MTSLTFMLVCVPEPVCQTRSGNSASRRPLGDVPGRLGDGAGDIRRQKTEVSIDDRGGLLDDPQRINKRHRHALVADLKVRQGSLRLRTPQPFGGNFDCAETVGFRSRRFGHDSSNASVRGCNISANARLRGGKSRWRELDAARANPLARRGRVRELAAKGAPCRATSIR